MEGDENEFMRNRKAFVRNGVVSMRKDNVNGGRLFADGVSELSQAQLTWGNWL